MDHKTLTIASILTIAVILVVGANIGLITSVSGKQIRGPPGPADPTNFGPNCVGCITTQNIANGAITHSKIALHSIDKTQLTFAIHNGTNGAQGPAGPVGQTGATGPQGLQGIQGPTGQQGPRGFNGTNGLTGAQGPAGLQGPAGPQGPRGFNGTNGLTGAQGPAGLQGPAGPAGQTGAIGPAGPQGPPGPGHVTIYNIPQGHDGWVVNTNFNDCSPQRDEFCQAGPYLSPPGGLGVISGSDLGNITSQSFVMAEQVNNGNAGGVLGTPAGGNLRPFCSVWDVFAGGFHAYCANSNTNTNLRVTVINP